MLTRQLSKVLEMPATFQPQLTDRSVSHLNIDDRQQTLAKDKSRSRAIKLIEELTAKEFEANKKSGQIRTEHNTYGKYIEKNVDFERMQNDLVRNMNIERSVAAYALLKVGHTSVDQAMDLVFELNEDGRM